MLISKTASWSSCRTTGFIGPIYLHMDPGVSWHRIFSCTSRISSCLGLEGTLQHKAPAAAILILATLLYFKIFIKACSPASPQALIVQANNCLSTTPSSISVNNTGKAPPSHTTEYILLRAATACTRKLLFGLKASWTKAGIIMCLCIVFVKTSLSNTQICKYA